MATGPTEVVLTSGTVDLPGRRVRAADGTVRALTPLEARLLAYLVERPGVDLTREQLLVEVWGHRATMVTRTVDNVVRKLRQKLGEPAGHPKHLVTCSGGYRFERLSARRAVGVPLDASFGRDDVRRAVLDQLTRRRWVALVGRAGAGKSRLAREVLRELGAPCAWVDAAGAGDAAALEERIGAALRLGADGARPPLMEALSRIPDTLIVLDGLEVDDAATRDTLQGWVEADTAIRWLVTARRAPGLRGEVPLEVGPLTVEAAAALFRDRSGQAADDAVVHAIVDRVDRLPLAVELAASRSRVVGPRAVMAELDADADSGDPALAAAWTALSEEARAALIGCTLLPGSFTAAAAEAVIGARSVTLLAALHAAGLIHPLHDPRRGGHPRLEVLASVRAFVARRGAPDAASRARLRAYAVTAFDRGTFWPERLAPERAVLELAFRSALEEGTDDEVAEIAIRLDRALVLTGTVAERRRVVARALGHSAGTARSAGLHGAASTVAHLAGDATAAWDHAREMECVATTEVDRAAADRQIGVLLRLRGDRPAARERIESALRRYEPLDDPCGTVQTLHDLVLVLGPLGESRELDRYVGRALDLVSRIPDAHRLTAMVELAAAAADAGRRPEVALARQERAARALADLGDGLAEVNARFDAALSCLDLGRDAAAEDHLVQAWTCAQRFGLTAFFPRGAVAGNLGLLRLVQGDLVGGGEWIARERAAHASADPGWGADRVATHTAMVDLFAGRVEAAARALEPLASVPGLEEAAALLLVAEAMLGRADRARLSALRTAGADAALLAHVEAHLALDGRVLSTPEPRDLTARFLRRLLERRRRAC